MTVCALPSSDLQTRPTSAPGRGRLDRGPQPGAARPDDQDVVGVPFGGVVHSRMPGSLNRPERQDSDVQVGERHGEQAGPGPAHVVPVEAREPLPERVAGRVRRRAREAVQPAADEVAQRVARQRVATSAARRSRTGRRCPARAASGPSTLSAPEASSHRKNSGTNARYRKIAMEVLEDERERRLHRVAPVDRGSPTAQAGGSTK